MENILTKYSKLFLDESSSKLIRSTARTMNDRDHSILQNKGSIPTSPKSSATTWRKSFFNNTIEQDSNSSLTDPIYGNVNVTKEILKKELSSEDEGNLIEHDLLDLVEKEQQKDIPPALPMKKRTATIIGKDDNLDVNIEPMMKLAHLGNDEIFPMLEKSLL